MLAFRTSQSIHSPKDWTSPELKEIDSLLRCPICYDFMHTAMILPDCSHTFCSFCIRHHLSHTNKCPVCNNSACENNLRNNRLVDDLIVEFKSVRSHLMEITQGLATERKGGSGRHVNKSISQEMTQNEVSLKKKTASKDDIIDLVSEDGDENETTCVDTGSRENKENIGVVDQGLHTPRAKSGIQLSDVDKMGEFSSPRSQDSSFEGFLSPSQRKMVPCPVCGISLRQNAINEHLDICLGGEERKSALRKQMPKRKPIAKLVYNLMSEKDIKRKLKEVGLSTTGEKKALVRRHHDFVMLYNSECDSLKPRSVQDIVKEVEKTEAVRHRTRKDGNRLVIEKNSSPASIEKAQKHYMKKHKSHFSCLIEETRKRMREQKENRKSLKERRQNEESQSETSVAVGCNTGMELTRSESDCEMRRKTPGGYKRNKGAVTGGTHRDTGTSGKGEQNVVVSSQSETESGGRSNRKKRKSQPDTAAEDTSDFEIVSLQSDSESESRHSEKRKGKPDVGVQLKTSGSSIQKGLINSNGNNEREGNLTTSDTFGGVGNVTSDKNDTSQVLAQTEAHADLRKKSRRNRSKESNSKSQSKDNQSIQDTEESGQGRTRSRNKHTAGKADNSAFELTDVKKSDDNQADVGETDVQKRRRRTRRVYDKPVSSSGSSRSKKTYRDAEIEDISSVCMKKAEIVPEEGWKELNHDPSEGRFSIKPALLENVDNSPTFEVEKSNTSTVWNDEKRTTRKRNVKSASSSREKEMVDGEVNKPLPVVPDHGNKTDCFITTVPVDFSKVKWTEDEKDEQSRLQKQFLGSLLRIPEVNNASSTAADGEVEIPPHSDTVEETGGGKGTQPLKTPSGKSEPLSSEGQCEQRREAETDYKDEDESAHVNETPVKDLDVANFSTMWAALSGEVDMSRARHFSNMSTQSDKSSYSDLSAVISPVNSERGIGIPGEKRSLRTSARRERVEHPKNRKRKRDCQSISRKRRRR